MSLFTPSKTTDAIDLLKEDHDKVKEIFEKFENAEDKKTKKKLAKEAIEELKIHATVEEKLFYPAVRQQMDDEEGIMEEADEEHHVAKVLIAELEEMTGSEAHWEAKFIVLAENIRHHIKEEENEMLPEAKKTNIDFEVLGQQMLELKQQLKKKGVPPDAEAKMIQKAGLRGNSPAKNAQKTVRVPLKSNN